MGDAALASEELADTMAAEQVVEVETEAAEAADEAAASAGDAVADAEPPRDAT
jgi:hypothetical protein